MAELLGRRRASTADRLLELGYTLSSWALRLAVVGFLLAVAGAALHHARDLAREEAREAVDAHERFHPDHEEARDGD